MKKWFNKQSRLVQILLLLIPGVNWFVEIFVRWDMAINYAKKSEKVFYVVVALVVTLFGLVFGWVDLIWVLLFKKLLFTKK